MLHFFTKVAYMSTPLPTAPYKGTRDFYPKMLQKRSYIFSTWRNVLEKKGFSEYETSVLENADIYIAKSGEELGGSQLYNFHDKGERFIALRPEQTPSTARMIANQYGELRFPLRWFSIPNCFRYERPQKGRLREHWQLNVDIIGLEAGYAELELIMLVGDIFEAFGADKKHFSIQYNHRKVLDNWLEKYDLLTVKSDVYSILDGWYKVSLTENTQLLENVMSSVQVQSVLSLVSKQGAPWEDYTNIAVSFPEILLLLENTQKLKPNLEYILNPCIIRGIAYYTGLVFEAFDKNPENSRALFGGGRYDTLMELFGKQSPALGFGYGDVTMDEFLSGHGLYPDFSPVNLVGIMLMDKNSTTELFQNILPNLEKEGKVPCIDYETTRSENKRYESLKKRGCSEVIKV
jgi:histidyl-tRNA synthetase